MLTTKLGRRVLTVGLWGLLVGGLLYGQGILHQLVYVSGIVHGNKLLHATVWVLRVAVNALRKVSISALVL